MKRRRLLALGLGSAAVLAVGGGALLAWRPAVRHGRLTTSGREVLRALARAVLDGVLPPAQAQVQALDGLLDRIDDLIGVLPAPVVQELGQLLSLLASTPGRLALMGLRSDWPEAGVADMQRGLQDMRLSALTLRQQAYHALRDTISGSYFAAPGTWSVLGYPGPVEV